MPFITKEVAAIEDSGGRVPEGRHVVTCIKGTEDQAQKGEIWSLEYKTVDGGIVKDKLRWYGGALGRCKKVVETFYPDYLKQEHIGAADLEGKRAAIDVVHREFTGTDGKEHVVAEVEFGYHLLTGDAAQASEQGKAAVRSLFDKPAAG